MTGHALLAVGAGLVLPQIIVTMPLLFALGVTLMLAGGIVLADRGT